MLEFCLAKHTFNVSIRLEGRGCRNTVVVADDMCVLRRSGATLGRTPPSHLLMYDLCSI